MIEAILGYLAIGIVTLIIGDYQVVVESYDVDGNPVTEFDPVAIAMYLITLVSYCLAWPWLVVDAAIALITKEK
jgi:hypothetical protein